MRQKKRRYFTALYAMTRVWDIKWGGMLVLWWDHHVVVRIQLQLLVRRRIFNTLFLRF